MTSIMCTPDVFEQTIAALRAGGARSEERVVLWLATASASKPPIAVVEVYEPTQITDIDYFRLPADSLRNLLTYLRTRRLKIVAQVHSHPGKAYHSKADNEWAIIRQVGALSLVLPNFASDTTCDNFFEKVVTYELSAVNTWIHVPNEGPDGRLGMRR